MASWRIILETALDAFTADEVWASIFDDVSHGFDWNLGSTAGIDQDTVELAQIVWIAQDEREADLAFEDSAKFCAYEGRLDFG